jgi:D-alanyl-D-alanine dipeptidase
MKKDLKSKFFDCYRPLDIQKKMWKIVSNPEYVANPPKVRFIIEENGRYYWLMQQGKS